MMGKKARPAGLREGQALRSYKTTVRSERQQRYHDAAEMPSHLFGDHVDLSILAIDTILAARTLAAAGGQSLHAGQRMIQHTPIYLGEELQVDGCVAEIRPAARGTFVIIAFDFVRADGSIPLKAELTSLRLDNVSARAEDTASSDETLERAGLLRITGKHLTAAMIEDYSFEYSDNSGPAAPANLSFAWMMEAIAREGMPQALDLSATFRRPLFEDDSIQAFWRGKRDLLLAKSDGLICATGRVGSIAR